jgi:hypothetical protein
MSTGRDTGFIHTITFYYRQELGRTNDPRICHQTGVG